MPLLHLPTDQPTLAFRLAHTYDTELRLGTQSKGLADDDSGICSPPLWRTSPPTSPQQRKNYYRSLSPASRTEAVARGQKELMEMVRTMPECTYELSLKDLVERPRVDARDENAADDRNFIGKHGHKRGNSIRKVKRGGNMDGGGFYLKMMFPAASLGYKKKKKKKNESSANGSSKVSPRHSLSDGSVKGADKDWWKKSLSASEKSDSGASTINSGSTKSSGSSRTNSRHESSGEGCWPFLSFIRRPKSLTQKS